MPTIHTYKTFKFSELSEGAQERAIDNVRTSEGYLSYEWWDTIYEDFKTACECLGVEVDLEKTFFSGFSIQGQGAAFTADYKYKKGWKKDLKENFGGESLETLSEIGDTLQEAQKNSFYQLTAITKPWSHNTYSQSTQVNHYEHNFDGFNNEQEEMINSAFDDLGSYLFKQLQSEYKYLMSDDAVKDIIISGCYDFYEDGQIHQE